MEASSDKTPIWKKSFDLDWLNEFSQGCMVSHIGIEFIEIGDASLTAQMPVDSKTTQPLGLLHGGASVVLAETLGSTAAHCSVPDNQFCVGIEINANHIRAARSGIVIGVARPVHLGRQTHVWQTEISDPDGRLISTSRMTLAVLDKK